MARFIITSLSFSFLATLMMSASGLAQVTSKNQLIFLAVDGLSLESLQVAQQSGLLTSFKVSAHVAPFPSMSDVSWNSIMRTTEVFGIQGRPRSVEAVYFDESTQSLAGDPRDYFRRLANPKYYMGGFSYYMNPYVESLMYVPTEEVPKLEITSVISDLISAPEKPVLTGFIGALDSMAHTKKDRLFPMIRLLDSELKRLVQAYAVRNINAHIVLVSDHGNVGRFKEGSEEVELEKINLDEILKPIGLNWKHSLKNSNDVAVPLLALGSWAPVYLKDRSHIGSIVNAVKTEAWFDLAFWVAANSSEKINLRVSSKDGEAELVYFKGTHGLIYEVRSGNPLGLEAKYISAAGNQVVIAENDWLLASLNTPYPDSLYRLIQAGLQTEYDLPDLILTSKDGYCFNNSLSSFTKMYRTHGALTRKASLGIVANNFVSVPGMIRSKEILKTFNIDPVQLFGETSKNHRMQSGLMAVQSQYKVGIRTDANDFSPKRIFQYITRFVSDTRFYFLIDEIKQLFDAFSKSPFKFDFESPKAVRFDPSKFDFEAILSPKDVAELSDAVIKDPTLNVLKDPVVVRIKSRVEGMVGLQESKAISLDENSIWDKFGPYLDQALATKRTAMKMTQVPILLDKTLAIQELPYLKDTRDLQFGLYWDRNKKSFIKSFSALNTPAGKDLTVVQRLMDEIHDEQSLEATIFPTTMPKIYNGKLAKLTIVYVPGIYNRIFDREIFSLGLASLSDELGLRVIRAPVYDVCSSDYNAQILVKFLKADNDRRKAQGHDESNYLILGYSKGAVDSLHAFVEDPAWMSSHVEGLVSIASPLHGTSILNKTDLPFKLGQALSEGSAPDICIEDKKASKSLSPNAMSAFWRKNERSLVGLTRYFSVTFKSVPEKSHSFMRATKLIGQFGEENDGVVTVTASKYPKALQAVDLGTVSDADHLAGILSAQFDQKSFMKGLITTLAELGIENHDLNQSWNRAVIVARAASQGILERLQQLFKKDKAIGLSLVELNRMVLPKIEDPANDYLPKIAIPPNDLKFDPYGSIDLRGLMSKLPTVKVQPSTKQSFPNGIDMTFNHKNTVHFRMDHQMNYESATPPGMDDNAITGYFPTNVENSPWLQLRSVSNSIRLSTFSYRFKVSDFPKVALRLKVTQPVVGADVIKGGTGKDDSAFQVWLTIREKNTTGNRTLIDPKMDNIILFGYYWGAANHEKEKAAGQIFENYYSLKSIPMIAVLPEAKQLLLDDPKNLNVAKTFERNLQEDLQKAFPNMKADEMEIIGITLQHDSNDTKSKSEVFFKSLKFIP